MGSQFQQGAGQGPAADAADGGPGSAGGGGPGGGAAGAAGEGGNAKRFRLYVGSLSYSSTTATLRGAFEEFGTLLDAEVVYDRTNHSKGFGFVSYDNEESMRNAINKMNGAELDGRKIEVTVAMPQGPKFGMGGGYNPQRGGMEGGRGPPRGYRVLIYGLPPTITWRHLKDFLRDSGCEVKYADIVEPGVGMGEFGTPAERASAIKTLNGKDLKGSKIHVKFLNEADMHFGGGNFGPRPGFFNEPFGFGGFDMFGPGFDQFPYGMPPPDFNMMGFPPPPAMPGWAGRGGMRHPGFGGMGPNPGMGGGYGRNEPGPRGWAGGGYGYDRGMGRGYDRGDSGRGYDRRGDAQGGFPGYERPPDGSYSRGTQGDRGPPDERANQGSRSYGQYSSERYGGTGETYPRQYDNSGKDGYPYSGYQRSGGQDTQGGYGGRYEGGGQVAAGYDRPANDVRGYSAYNRTMGQEDSRSGYGDYRGNGQQDTYGSGLYAGYRASGYSKPTVSGGGGVTGSMGGTGGAGGDRSSYDYAKINGPEDYAKYQGSGEYGRSDRTAEYAGYTQQDRRAYDYGRMEGGRSAYDAADYKRVESDYYADRRDYGNGRSHREEDPRGAGGADRRHSHVHRVSPYDR
ncbi:unnamed protein product [Ostreobium quekettii]|uniref:RRM domain-containing protein n=1 Tax=Ostreobium quekettii TaxID=121088 RepID=A0A8S1JDA7_9CHLO|nr:unnamed protein product [Ostreobium quekettii]|eukprot:evm.model.scf_2380.1 EVM.evm.TU.scf_2380.1   scf_2380:3286-7440(-)